MSCPHTQFRKGQRIRIAMKCGSCFVDTYRDTRDQSIFVEGAGKIKIVDILAVNVNVRRRR